MPKQYLRRLTLSSILLFMICAPALAQDDFSSNSIKTINITAPALSPEININLDENNTTSVKKITLTQNDAFYNSIIATDKFVQCNIRASWQDFKTLIETAPDNDFVYLSLADKMANLGFFDLANIALKHLQDNELTSLSADDMKRFYFPSRKISLEDEIFLAGIYSNITFNNQSQEATNELLKNETLLCNSDYANYLAALGFYKSKFSTKALKYINLAIIQNPSNLNYYKLKSEILADENKPTEAIATIEYLKRQNLYSEEYRKKIQSAEQYTLYKIKKAPWEKDYHLGYYYYIENDSSKAIRTLQKALNGKRNHNKEAVYALMSEIYFNMNEFEKAYDMAYKAHKINSNNSKSLLTLGDLSYMKKNYKQALSYYKKASAKDKTSYEPLIKEAQTYQKLSNTKKATEIYTKILKTHFDSYEAYYNIALLDPEKTFIYLKKALAINPMFENGWVELAKKEIERGNYEIATKYLSNVYYIDENNFKYYYYQGIICQNTGDLTQAKYNFKKCLKLNSTCKEAENALGIILKNESI